MNIALVAILGIVLLIGLVAFGVGHKGWSWGTVAFSFLAVFAAVGFVYLASRVAQRERVWREKVRQLEADVYRERDATQVDDSGAMQTIAGELSVDELDEQKDRWYRALERVNTWRNRSWSNGVFRPPQDDQPGQVIFQIPENAAPNPFINVGAQIYLFDSESADIGGRYLGVFRVAEAAVQEQELVLSVTPAATPTDVDRKLWRREYDSVQGFEGLPVDRWFAFTRTRRPDDEAEDEDSISQDGEEEVPEAVLYPVLPGLRKAGGAEEATAEDLLVDLEEQLDRFEKHEMLVPEDEWRPLVEAKNLPMGEYWAAVRFRFAQAMPTKAADREPGMIQFEKGDVANLPLDTAIELEGEGIVEIRSVFYRRQLVDMGIAMEGARLPARSEGADEPINVEVPGVYFIHARLTSHISRLTRSIDDLVKAKDNATTTMDVLRKAEGELNDDLPRWGQEVAVATEVCEGLEARLADATKRLDEAWEAVVQLGRQYDGEMALLQTDAEKRSGGRE